MADHPTITLRTAAAADQSLLFEMLAYAVNWDPERPGVSAQEIRRTPELAHYVSGWPQPGDLGIVASDADGSAVGAAWLRRFTTSDPSYGFVDDETPELSVGVAPAQRGRGIGTALCRQLLAAADAAGIAQVSLSVEKGNRARHLYDRLGFETVEDTGDAVTMLRRMPSGPGA